VKVQVEKLATVCEVEGSVPALAQSLFSTVAPSDCKHETARVCTSLAEQVLVSAPQAVVAQE
jgi:hypothetical protein